MKCDPAAGQGLGWNSGTPICHSMKDHMSAARACNCTRVLPWPWPLSYSRRISTGLPLLVAVAKRT